MQPDEGATAAEVDQLVRGHPVAWEAFLRRYLPLVYGAVLRTLGSTRNDADDVVQDVLLRLCRNGYGLLRRYDPSRSSLSTWLCLIARSAAIDALRRRRVAFVPLEAAPEPITAPQPVDTPVVVPKEVLTPRQRLVLRLLYDEDLDPAEAAAVLGVEVQTVRSAHHKALVRLRRLYDVGDRE